MLIVKVHNDGSGTSLSANYDVEVSVNLRTIWRGRVTGHNRHYGWPALLEEIAQVARKSGNDGPDLTPLHRREQHADAEARGSSGYEWLTTAEAAKYLQIKNGTLLLWTRQGKIKGHALSGGKRRVLEISSRRLGCCSAWNARWISSIAVAQEPLARLLVLDYAQEFAAKTRSEQSPVPAVG